MEQATGSREKGFKGLLAWQSADRLAREVYSVLRNHRDIDPWLVSQATRSAISVPANIAEGYGRGALGDYLRFLDIARGSLSELEYYLHFFATMEMLNGSDVSRLELRREEAGRLLAGLWRSMKTRNKTSWNHDGMTPGSERITTRAQA